jgi:hypothetical protein
MTVAPSNTWVDKFRSQSESDTELQAHGKFYSCSFLLDAQEHRYLVRMHHGKVEELLVDPGPLTNVTNLPFVPAQIPGANSHSRFHPCDRYRKNEPLAIGPCKSLALSSRRVISALRRNERPMILDQRMAHSSISVYNFFSVQ